MASAKPVITRHELETQLIEKAWKDQEFRNDLLSDPKGMLEKQLGQKLPDKLEIFIHEEDANALHFSIPPTPANITELLDEDLEKVAGGTQVNMTGLLITHTTITFTQPRTIISIDPNTSF